MAALPIHWIEARTHCHATEDEDRVEKALAFVVDGGRTKREALEGHHGNPIVRLRRHVEGPSEIRAIWSRWSDAAVPDALRADVAARVDDEGVLHFRLDKQAAYAGTFALAKDTDSIDVRVRLRAFPAAPEALRRAAASLLEAR
ncbi:MAG: RNA-binding domain-containing protein [Methanobacteriota archaeon]